MELNHDKTTLQTLVKLYDVLCGVKKRKHKICVQTMTMGSYPPSNAKIKSDSGFSRNERMSQLVPAVESERKPSKKDAMCDCCDLCFCYSQEEFCVKKHPSEDRKSGKSCKQKPSPEDLKEQKRSSAKRHSSEDLDKKCSSEEMEPLVQRKRSSSDQPSFRNRLSSENISEVIHKAASERSFPSIKSDINLSTCSEDMEDDQKIIDECDLDEGRCKEYAECKCCKHCVCYKDQEVKNRTSEPKKAKKSVDPREESPPQKAKKSADPVREESPKRLSNKVYFDENYTRYKEISDSILEDPSPPKEPPKEKKQAPNKKKAQVKKKAKKGNKKKQKSKSITPSRDELHSHSYHRLENTYLTTVKSDSSISIKSDINSQKPSESESDKPKNIQRKLSDVSVQSGNSDASKRSEEPIRSEKSPKKCPGKSEKSESIKEPKERESPKIEDDEKVDDEQVDDKKIDDEKVDDKKVDDKEEFKGSTRRIVVKKGGCDIFPLKEGNKIRKASVDKSVDRRKSANEEEEECEITIFLPQDTSSSGMPCKPRRCKPRPCIPTCPSPCRPPPCCNPCPPLCYNLSADSLPKQMSNSSLYFMNKRPKILCKTIVTSKGQVTICRSDKKKNKKWDFTKKGMKCISYETKDPDSKVMKKSEICFETEEDLVRALFAARNFKKKLQKSWNSHHRIEDKKAKPFKQISDFKIQPIINKIESPKDNSFYYPKSYVKRVKNFRNIQRKPIRKSQITKAVQVDQITKKTKNMAIQTSSEPKMKESKDACTSYDQVTKSPKVSFSNQNELKNYKILVKRESSGVKEEAKSQEKGLLDIFLKQNSKKEDVSKVEEIIKNLFDTLFVQKAEQLIRHIEEKTKRNSESGEKYKNVPLIQGSQIKMIRAFEQIYGNRRREKPKSSLSFGGIDSDLKSQVLDRKNDSKDKISINLFDRFKCLEVKNEGPNEPKSLKIEENQISEVSTKLNLEETPKNEAKNQEKAEELILYANTGHKDWKTCKEEQKPKIDKVEGFRFKMDSNLGLGVPKMEIKETKKPDDGGQKNFLNVIKLALEEYEEYEKDSKAKNVTANHVLEETSFRAKNDLRPSKWQMSQSMEDTLRRTSLAPFLNLSKNEKKHDRPSCSAKGDMARQTLAYPCLVENNFPIWTIDLYLESLHKLSETLDTQLIEIKHTFNSKLHFLFERNQDKDKSTTQIQKELAELKVQIRKNPFSELRKEISTNSSLSNFEQNRILASIDSEVKRLSSIEERVDTIIEDLKNNVECELRKKNEKSHERANSKTCVQRLEHIGQILQKELVNIKSILAEKEES